MQSRWTYFDSFHLTVRLLICLAAAALFHFDISLPFGVRGSGYIPPTPEKVEKISLTSRAGVVSLKLSALIPNLKMHLLTLTRLFLEALAEFALWRCLTCSLRNAQDLYFYRGLEEE